jgi:tagaturonate reductase
MAPLARLERQRPARPERIVQFGTGAFLRGFVDFFVDEANRRGLFDGSVVAVSSTGSDRDRRLNEQGGVFTLVAQGLVNERPVRDCQVIESVSRALSAGDDWPGVLAVARNPAIEAIVSNTTEVGIVFDETDSFAHTPPRSFPGKLTRFLYERATHFAFAPSAGVVVLPCELIENNGDTLRGIVTRLATAWELGAAFTAWLDAHVVFCNTLVDRIVPGALPPGEAAPLAATLGYSDDLMTSCEIFRLFAIEGDERLRARLSFTAADAGIVVVPDVRPYRERKVRILNGAHTAMVSAALLAGLETVRESIEDERLGRFVRHLMFEEIVPTLDVPGAEDFAHNVLQRFANPYIRHELIDITLNGAAKVRTRVVPSIRGFVERTGQTPASLCFAIAAYIAFMRGDVQARRTAAGQRVPADAEGERIRAAWSGVESSRARAVQALAEQVCGDASLWGEDLTSMPSATDAIAAHLVRIVQNGVTAGLDAHLLSTASASTS